jgi:hypothetical protein
MAGDRQPPAARPDDRQAARPASTEEKIMAMTWMETAQLLGLDLMAGTLAVLFAFDCLERAVRSAWDAARSRRHPRVQRPSAATHAAVLSCE